MTSLRSKGDGNPRTEVRQIGRVLSSDMTEVPSCLLDRAGRLWVIGVDILEGDGKINEVLSEITKYQTHERLWKAIHQLGSSTKKSIRHTPARHLRRPRR